MDDGIPGRDIIDSKFLLYSERFLEAGVMEEGAWWKTEAGVPQGGSISPVPANVYLQCAVDMWFTEYFARAAKGYCHMAGCADDVVMCFRYKEDVGRCNRELKERLAKFGLDYPRRRRRSSNSGDSALA